ncbi:type II secretion system F family protein [Pseudoalteromonas denitrificans]|uniref:Tight adherence protein B n=1 Tax=Pseudoalteromonas denitrificans DSM 6059 TaxID=1123010 RepID=A0A1I1LP97_9GAMM|nr:type II secretion system F family protein [Pseudoalteromonas denitrificans]SFC74891.1 tight adherence protein B [Pseudoalteromonas denitrificans DSM 6059]
MIFLFIALVLILVFTTFAMKNLSRQKGLLESRLNRYLTLTPSSDSETDQTQLFNVNKYQKGWQLWLYLSQQKLASVISTQFAIKLIAIALVSIFPAVYLTSSFALGWQIVIIILSYLFFSFLIFNSLLKRQRAVFEEDFPVAIATISRAISAGVTVSAAMAHVTKDMQGPVPDVFKRITDLLAIGITLEDALTDASLRVDLPSFKFFTVTLLLNQNSGGQLTFVLHQLMANLHERKAMQQKLMSMTAEPRVSAKIIALLPPLFLLLFWFQAPHIFDYLFYQEAGQLVSAYAAISITIGLLLINKMTKIDY